MSLPRVRISFFGDEDLVPLSKRIELVYAVPSSTSLEDLLPMETLVAELLQAEEFVKKLLACWSGKKEEEGILSYYGFRLIMIYFR